MRGSRFGQLNGGVTKALGELFQGKPYLPRLIPFLVFLGFTVSQGTLGEGSKYWFYFAKTIVGAWMLWAVWEWVPECRWHLSPMAIGVGIGVFILWVGIDPYVPTLKEMLVRFGLQKASNPELPWNPHAHFGSGSALAWMFVVARLLGSTFIVPPLEETFYRSFFYRSIASPDFEKVPLNRFHTAGFIGTALVFGLGHNEWLAAILCAAAYQWLVIRRGDLGDAITAHAITNALLGGWVLWRDAWKFW